MCVGKGQCVVVRDNVLVRATCCGQGQCVGKGQCVVVRDDVLIRDNVLWSGTMCFGKGQCVVVRDDVSMCW